MGRPKNLVNGESFSITVTDDTYALLEQLCECGYGCNVPDTAGAIVSAEVRRLVISGELDKLMSARPRRRAAIKGERDYPQRDE